MNHKISVPPPQRSVWWKVLFFLVLVILIGSYIFVSFSPKPVDLKISSRAIRDSVFDYAVKTFFIPEGQGHRIVQISSCDSNGQCSSTEPALNPALSWSMLFLGQAIKDYKDSDPKRLKIARDLLVEVFSKWVGSADGYVERVSLHQHYEVTRLTNDPQYLFWLYDRHELLKQYADENIRRYREAGKSTMNSYLVATMARELALILKAKVAFSIPGADGNVSFDPLAIADLNAERSQELARIRDLIAVAQADAAKGVDSNYGPLLANHETHVKIPQTTCFHLWAMTPTLVLTQDFKSQDGEVVNHSVTLPSVNTILSSIALEPVENLNFSSLQTLIPCVLGARELREHLANQSPQTIAFESGKAGGRLLTVDEIDRFITAILGKAIAPSVTADGLCRASQGISSSLEEERRYPDCNRSRNLVDNSWINFALGQVAPEQIFVIEP